MRYCFVFCAGHLALSNGRPTVVEFFACQCQASQYMNDVLALLNDISGILALLTVSVCVFRLSPMGSPLLWSFMQIGVKYAEN